MLNSAALGSIFLYMNIISYLIILVKPSIVIYPKGLLFILSSYLLNNSLTSILCYTTAIFSVLKTAIATSFVATC